MKQNRTNHIMDWRSLSGYLWSCVRESESNTELANDSSVYISFKSHFEIIFGRSQLFSVSVSTFRCYCSCCLIVVVWLNGEKTKFIVAFVEIQTSEGKETMTKQDNDDGDYSNSSSHNSDGDNNIATENGECQVNRNQRVWNAYLRIYSS